MATTLIRVDVSAIKSIEKIRKNLGVKIEYGEATEKALEYAAKKTNKVFK